MENEQPEPFHLGRKWAQFTTCCSKPVGCTNMSDQCLMRNHPWKRANNPPTAEETPDPPEVPVSPYA